jgi:DNA-binding transcriptional LysR family regulator
MHLEYLKIFSDLVKKRSFSEAAKSNGITQSAVSQQLKTMENHFKTQIVDRSQKQFRLTQEGEKIYRDSQEILRLYEKLQQEISELGDMLSGTVHISSTYSVGIHIVPNFVKSFIKSYPTIDIRLDYNQSIKVYDDVINNVADIGFVSYPQENRLLDMHTFMKEPLVLVCNNESKFARRKTIQLKELEDQKLISFESPMASQKALMAILKSEGVSVKIAKQFDNIEMIKNAVEIDLGVAILPISAVANLDKDQNLNIVDFKNKPYTRDIAVIYRKGKILTTSVKKFIEQISK